MREHRPDVAVMDLQMPVLDGVEATRAIVGEATGTEVLVLTSFSDFARIDAAIEAGAVGYLLKDAEPEVLLDGIRAVARGGSPLDPRAARRLLSSAVDRRRRVRGRRGLRAVTARGGGAAARGRGPAQQADRPAARHHRAHREGAPHLGATSASASPTAPRPPCGRSATTSAGPRPGRSDYPSPAMRSWSSNRSSWSRTRWVLRSPVRIT